MGGTAWEQVLDTKVFLNTTEKVYIHWLEIAPSDPHVVYALASIQYYDQGILLISRDGGDTWARSNSVVDGKGASLAVDPIDANVVYVGTRFGGGVYRSANGGVSFQAINGGLPSVWTSYSALAVDPSNPQRLYTAERGNVYYSPNSGTQWSQLGEALSATDEVTHIMVDPLLPGNVYATAGFSHAFRLVGWEP